jgi:hypothetical protein
MGEEPAEEFLPVAEAARRLGVSEPRLRRLLKLSEWAHAHQEREYRTRTGTRTGLVVPVSVLVSLGAALSKEGTEQERKREHVGAPAAPQETGLAVALLAEKDERIADLKAQLETKDRQIEALTTALRLAQENIAREQVLEAMPSGAAIEPKETEAGEEKAAEPVKQQRPWWRLWGQR